MEATSWASASRRSWRSLRVALTQPIAATRTMAKTVALCTDSPSTSLRKAIRKAAASVQAPMARGYQVRRLTTAASAGTAVSAGSTVTAASVK
ncbi:hypothetical protein ACFXAF_11435 [Kitasatospora sp. NPDC059463]|uniref:hypothetical protein n=1 Tax=Kitasatospora sp. NPDC059463 TaxID=3346842 RepID=UPI00367795C2